MGNIWKNIIYVTAGGWSLNEKNLKKKGPPATPGGGVTEGPYNIYYYNAAINIKKIMLLMNKNIKYWCSFKLVTNIKFIIKIVISSTNIILSRPF